MLEFGRLIRVVAVGHEERVRRSFERSLQRCDVLYVRLNDFTANLFEFLSGGFGGVTRDGADAVGVDGFFESLDDGTALSTGGANDSEERRGRALRDRHV